MIGARVGTWHLEAELGRGALGVVYRGRDYADPARVAAVKVLTDPVARDPAFLARFPGEMLPLQRLSHPNVARFYDSGVHAGTGFYACELVEGTDLGRRLAGGRVPWREALAVAVQAAHALKHAHQRNVLHRDLKPAHFLLAADGTLKLADFGVAKVIKPAAPDLGSPIGSAAYLPPEAASGKPFTRRSDFYSLGGVLYTLVTGRPPFTAATVVELVHKQCYALPERPALLVPDLPGELDEFICALLDKNPARRPGSAADVLKELDRIRGKLERKGESLTLPADPGTAETPAFRPPAEGEAAEPDAPQVRHRGLRFVALLTGLLLVVGVLGWTFLRPGPTADELIEAARPLLASADPADWDRAWDQYLAPLAQRHPGRYADEVADARGKIADLRELRRALAAGAEATFRSEAERCYARGLRLAQAGDPDAARRTWQAVVTAFGPVESERRWVNLSRDGLAGLEPPVWKSARTPPNRDSLRAALDHAKALAAAGKTADSVAAFAALELLFRDDPSGLGLIQAAREGKP